jgi:ABC-type branched-subunit amino acid transport system substrate-binding protein
MSVRHRFRTPAVAVLAAIVVIAAGCSDKKDSANGGAAPASSNPACTGAPLKFTSIGTLSGALSYPSLATEAQHGSEAALRAVNSECALGRPIQLTTCDDKSDPNEATKCGRQAHDDGSIALFGSSGTFDGGTSAANLPGVLTAGGSVFDLTDPRSFPISSPLTLVVGGAATANAAGIKDALMVSIDTAATRAFVQTSQEVAQGLGVKLDTLFIPPDTTDFAPVAAQIAERKPSGLGLILTTQIVPFFNALADENISPHDIPIFTAVTLMPPEVLKQLGSKADGVYLLTQQAPPSDTSNPGVQQMLKELKDAGFPSNGDELSPASTGAWANVHTLVDILKKLPPDQIAALNTTTIVDAMAKAGPINRPEIAPFDFTANAFPDIATLSSFRLYTRDAMVVRVENGKYVRKSDFVDATKPFTLEK